jgi:hypothetical protein
VNKSRWQRVKGRLYEKYLSSTSISHHTAKVEDLKSLIREGEADKLINEAFPLSLCGQSDENIKIKGTKSLIEGFNGINCKKLDIEEKLENIKLIGFTNDQLILNFQPTKHNGDINELTANGIYTFSHDFLNVHFDMGAFSKFCFSNGYENVLYYCITRLLENEKGKAKQYRLLEKKNQYYIRGLTSTRYKNYDNHLALYLTLYSLHSYAQKENVQFSIEKAYISDSELVLFIEQDNPMHINGVGKAYFGVMVSNNELADGALTVQFRYRVRNKDGLGFSCTENDVLSINHSTKIENVKTKLDSLNNFKKIRRSVTLLFRAIKEAPYLSKDNIFNIFKTVNNSRYSTFSKDTKEYAQELYKKINEDVENIYTIIELFNRLGEITTDIDEKIHLERICHEALLNHNRFVINKKSSQ